MDVKEALKLLCRGEAGINEWNQRRSAGEGLSNRFELADTELENADLAGANLSKLNLSRGNLSGADLTGANLSGANLSNAVLVAATLRHANLSGANISGGLLIGAVLRNANLTAALLRSSNLSRADLFGADLKTADLDHAVIRSALTDDANFSSAECGETIFAQLDLSSTLGLSEVIHHSPSSIDVETLFQSKGQIPVEFLRGVGVPEHLIEYLPSLIGSANAIEFHSCFISYSTKNEDIAMRLHSRMRDEKMRVWFAPEDVKAGQKLHEQIDRAIRVYDKLLLVLSEHSMRSEWVKTEIRKARKRELEEDCQVLFPIRLVPFEVIKDWECFDADSGKDLGVEIREYFIPDFSNWKDHDAFEAGFERLLSDLKKSTRGSA